MTHNAKRGPHTALSTRAYGRSVARLFVRPLFAQVARAGSLAPVQALLDSLGVADGLRDGAGAFFDAQLATLQRFYRCEYVYKAAITDRIVFGRHNPRTAGLQLELPVGKSIVDVAVFNGTSTAYEIKTEFDSHKRLVTQTPDYLKAFDQVYVVTHPALAERYLALVDHSVGLLVLKPGGSLSEVRPPQASIQRIDPLTLFFMLRQAERRRVVEHYFGPKPQLPNGLIDRFWLRYFRRMTAEQAHEGYVNAMRARSTGAAHVDYVSKLPKSLRVLGYATPLSGVQRKKLLQAFS